jgi:hypothetical protein
MALNVQTPVTGIIGMLGTGAFENYMAATVEEITLGRNPVTSIAPLPNRVFDVVWKMNLNNALNAAGVKSPSVYDTLEQGPRFGTILDGAQGNSPPVFFNYNLTTDNKTKIIKVVKVKNQSTNDIEKIIYGDYTSGIYLSAYNNTATMNYDGTYITGKRINGKYVVYNTTTRNLLTLNGGGSNGTYGTYGTFMNDSGTFYAYTDYPSTTTIINVSTFKMNFGFTGATTLSASNGSTGLFIAPSTNNNYWTVNFTSDGTKLIYAKTTSFSIYDYTVVTASTHQWSLNATSTYSNIRTTQNITGISSSADGTTIAYFDSTNVTVVKWNGSAWNVEYDTPITNIRNIKLSRDGNMLIINSSGVKTATRVVSNWTMASLTISFTCSNTPGSIYLNSTNTEMILNNWQLDAFGWTNPSESSFYKFTSGNWVHDRNNFLIGYSMSDDFKFGMATVGGQMLYNSPDRNPSGDGYLFKSRNVGIGTNEVETCANLALKLATDGTNVIELPTDGSMNVYSSISPSDSTAISNAIFNSLSTVQNTAIATFMNSLKGISGTYKWYNANVSNKQSIQTQVKLGLAQLFDKNAELNNLIGSSATSSTFLDTDKIATKMQFNSDTFWTKFFSEQQLKEVLSAVADKGSRILKATASMGINTFNFSVGDTISAMLKVTDSDTTSLNSDRWMITLQHAV